MKKRSAAASVLIMCALVTASCGPLGNTQDSPEETTSQVVSREEAENSADEASAEQTQSTDEQIEIVTEKTSRKAAHFSVGNSAAPAVTDVVLIPDDEIDISRRVSFEDWYGRHALHSGVVGLVGSPIGIRFDDDIGKCRLVFVYDPEKLEGVRPDALMFMRYDEEGGGYIELEGETLDTENHAVMIDIDMPGDYMLVNRHEWFDAWGIETGDDGLEEGYVNGYSSDRWAGFEYTGEIADYADIEYIQSVVGSGSARFSVSTPEELASAVYYVNCAPADNGMNTMDVYIELLEDIDLDGIEWACMGWDAAGLDNRFKGTFNGNGHIIKNMSIEGGENAGFIGESFYCSVYDVSFENASVKGELRGAVVMGNDTNSVLKNVSARGEVDAVTAGALAAYGGGTQFIDCSADVTVNGEPCGEYLSHTQKEIDETLKNLNEKVDIWVDGDNVVHRGENDFYTSLTWYITRDGERILERGADRETELGQIDMLLVPGHYTVYLESFVEGNYVPVSDTVEYDIE